MNKSLHSVEILGGLQGGIGFNPKFDIFYGVDINTDQVIAFNTTSFAEIGRYPVGENVVDGGIFGNGVMSFSGDGRYLFLSTPTGVRMLDVLPVPEPSAFAMITCSAIPLMRSGRRRICCRWPRHAGLRAGAFSGSMAGGSIGGTTRSGPG
jgi:hypothetical protein